MTEPLAALVLLSTLCLIQTAEGSHPISSTTVKLGDSVTLYCAASTHFYWYKQPLGRTIQVVAGGVNGNIKVREQFKDSHFIVTKNNAQFVLTIRNIRKEDEAMYFCESGFSVGQCVINSTFITVNDQRNQEKFIYVEQNPPTVSVQPGDPVTLQCLLLSEDREDTVQCPGEHHVHWFRAGSAEFHPGIIYTHKNESEELVKRTCVYRLSKTIRDSSDSGTYYCAVVTCGHILFGEGTQVETNISEPDQDPVVLIVLGVLLGCCVTVITVLCVLFNRRRICEHCKSAVSGVNHLEHDRRTGNLIEDLDGGAKDVNYAALTFSARRAKQGNKKKREQDCVYSAVRANYHTQQNSCVFAEQRL